VHYWAEAILTADVSTALTLQASTIPDVDVQTIRTAGLLHNLGLLWLATWMPAETHRALSVAGSEDEKDAPVDALLEEHCGIGYCDAGAYLAEAWKFPDLLIIAFRHQQAPEYRDQDWEAANLIGITRRLIRQSEAGENEPLSDPRLARLGIEPDDLVQTLAHIGSRKQEILELAQTLFAA